MSKRLDLVKFLEESKINFAIAAIETTLHLKEIAIICVKHGVPNP